MASVVAVSVSEKKGMRKKNVPSAEAVRDFGLAGDAHASGEWHRQVSLLAIESIQKMRDKGLDVGPGDFAENITTTGIDLVSLPVGTKLRIGASTIGEVSQIGKECHDRCAIYYQAGDCVMPREGIFITIIEGGSIAPGDEVVIL